MWWWGHQAPPGIGHPENGPNSVIAHLGAFCASSRLCPARTRLPPTWPNICGCNDAPLVPSTQRVDVPDVHNVGERVERPLARLELVGMSLSQIEATAAVVEEEPAARRSEVGAGPG